MSDPQDRLYDLLPAIYRQRDAEEGYPLKALLRVIAEQVNVVEEDIRQLYDNWFIETAQDWVVPYLGDLIGYRPVHAAGEPGDPATAEGAAHNQVLIPRRDVANTLRYRRRKGTPAVLEELALDVAGWPARAVEFFSLLGWTQNLNYRHLHGRRARTVDVRDGDALNLIDGPFDPLAHSVDVRRIDGGSPGGGWTLGRYNLPSVGVFVWRLKSYPVTKTPAYCLEQVEPHCYAFSVLGQDTPLYTQPNADPAHLADEITLPGPIRRRALDRQLEDYYGEGRSLAVYADWAGHDPQQPLPAKAILVADLTDWTYLPPRNHLAVDPVRGRLAFPPDQLPKKVKVSYHSAFSADIGGGEYDRPLSQPAGCSLYRVGEGEAYRRLEEALKQWRADHPPAAVIELTSSGTYTEPIGITLARDQSLQLRAANAVRPVLRLLDWQTDQPDALNVTLDHGSRFTLDGLLVTGRGMQINGAPREKSDRSAVEICPAQVTLRHCTLVPGWGLDANCEPHRPAEPSLALNNVRARVAIEHCLLGALQINEDDVRSDPIPIQITDSLVDAMRPGAEAIGAPGYRVAHAVLTIQRCTLLGIVDVHAIALAENSLFMGCLNVARRQLGCMRFCYVPRGCRTPRRYHCQPDLAEQAIEAQLRRQTPGLSGAAVDAAKASERERVQPQFNSERYGKPAYGQLADTCADEIRRGADDESELGVFHDLFQPQRAANLRARLDEYTPAGMHVGLIFAS